MATKVGYIMMFMGVIGITMSFFFQSFTDAERWIIIIFCFAIIIIGILYESKSQYLFKEKFYQEYG